MWSSNLPVQRSIALAMFGCICWAFVEMSLSMGLGWPQAFATGLMAFAVFAAGLALGGRETGRAYRKYTDYSLTDWALLLVPILLVLKLLPYALQGLAALNEEVASWMVEPQRFWDVTLVWSLLLVFFVWDFSVRVAEEFGKLSFQPAEIDSAPTGGPGGVPPAEIEGVYAWSQPAAAAPQAGVTRAPRAWDRSPYRFTNHARAWRSLMWSFVGGGFSVLIFAGLALVTPEELGDPGRAEVPGVVPPVLLYYVLGLVLASQTSLDRLRAEWLRVGAEVQSGLARRWLSYGVTLMVAALVIALLLPTTFIDPQGGVAAGGVLGLITAPLRLVLGAVFGALGWILAHVAAILFAPIAGLLPRGSSGLEQHVPPPPARPSESPAPVFPTAATQLAFAVLFYVIPAALAAYAIWNTWRKRRALWKGLREFWRDVIAMIWGAILDVAATLWRLLGAVSPRFLDAAPAQIRARWRQRRRTAGAGARPGWLRLRGLSARDLIQYFYVSLVQRAAGVGWARAPAQTAYEYSSDLASKLPERAAELRALTDAFVDAKYSRRRIDDEDARRARRPWERLRGELQVRRRANRLASWFGLGRPT